MPDYDPPAHYVGRPNRYLLPAGTILWRLHRRDRAATEFTRHGSGARGGRFDGSPSDPYSSYNAGLDAAATLAEVLLRSIPLPVNGFRTLRRVSVAGQRASAVATAIELSLVSLLTTPDLTAAAQDHWLIYEEDCDDPRVRRWASWIRAKASWAEGFIWPARRDAAHALVVLFGDRCNADVLEPKALYDIDLDTEEGAAFLNGILVRYRVRVAPPPAATRRRRTS